MRIVTQVADVSDGIVAEPANKNRRVIEIGFDLMDVTAGERWLCQLRHLLAPPSLDCASTARR